CSQALAREPGNAEALTLLQRITAAMAAPAPAPPPPARPGPQRLRGYDWARAEDEFAGVTEPVPTVMDTPSPVVEDVEHPGVRLADVGGMQQVKERLQLSFLGPMRNPQLAKAFGKSLSGGLLLYGPPGCGKTFIARAVAGELGASFFSVGISDVLD